MNVALAAAATLVAAAFTLSLLDRAARRRRPHDVAWTVSLAMFTVGAGTLWWAESLGWTSDTFRLFYLTGAILNVPWLALGTVYLLGGPQLGHRVRAWLIAASGVATGVKLSAPTTAAAAAELGEPLPSGRHIFGAWPRVLAAVGSGVAAVVIVVGALWSAGRVMRGRAPSLGARPVGVPPRQLALGNVLIAVGTLVLSASGTLAGRLGKDRAFAVTLLVGVAALFAGFLVASSRRVRQ